MHHKYRKLLEDVFHEVKKITALLITCILLNFVAVQNGFADENQPDDALTSIVNVLESLTCETENVGSLLRNEFSHTCIPAPFFTFAIANIISPGFYPMMMLRLKINDKELFEDIYPDGQCARSNRVDPNDPKITFALCNNILLAAARTKAVAMSAVAIAKAVITNTNPWDDIKDAWLTEKKSYHIMYKDKPEGFWGIVLDAPPFPVAFKVIKKDDRMCVASPTLLADWVAVGCKYIAEPFPQSIYSSFMALDGAVDKATEVANDPMAIVSCGMAGATSCYQRAYNNSKTAIVISSPIIECIKEMTARLLISNDVCTFDDINEVINSSKRESSVLFQFQRNMHRIVMALLTAYVMLFGIKILLSGDVPPKNEIINFVLKMIFVIYFSIGLNVHSNSNSDYDRLDGMTQWAFPILLGGIDTLAGWVMSASPSELCKFDSPDIHYDKNLSYMALWDSLDCRISHYLGLDVLATMLVENASRATKVNDWDSFIKSDFFSFPVPPYVYLLIPAILSGNFTLISLALSYPLLVISVAAFMINATVMCMVSIVILGVLAPLFVPMLLFEYTRGYFESWVKLLISFLLQPMVIVTFMITMFSVYDLGFYGHCKYKSSEISSTLTDGGDGKRKVRVFYINNNWQDYDSEEDVTSCKNSLGFMLNNPLTLISDFTKPNLEEAVKQKPGTVSTDSYMKQFDFLEGIYSSPGMFFSMPQLIFEKIKNIILALITACFTLYLLYHFSSQLAEFAADMTEGVALTNVSINPQIIFKAGMAAIGAAGKASDASKASGSGKDSVVSRSGGGDSMSASQGPKDSISGSSKTGDSVSASRGDSVPEDSVTRRSSATTIPSRPDASDSASEMAEHSLNIDSDSLPIQASPETTARPKPSLDISRPKPSGLDNPSIREKEDHTLKIGEPGYVKQEKRNQEIRSRNSSLDIEEQSSYASGLRRGASTRASEDSEDNGEGIGPIEPRVKTKKDGPDE